MNHFIDISYEDSVLISALENQDLWLFPQTYLYLNFLTESRAERCRALHLKLLRTLVESGDERAKYTKISVKKTDTDVYGLIIYKTIETGDS